jgi:hypothetical protein
MCVWTKTRVRTDSRTGMLRLATLEWSSNSPAGIAGNQTLVIKTTADADDDRTNLFDDQITVVVLWKDSY